MFVVNLCGTDLELPLSDEEMVAIKKEKKIDLFLRREDTICIKADYRGVDLKEKLPASLWMHSAEPSGLRCVSERTLCGT